jgi:ERCC4-type nuclease
VIYCTTSANDADLIPLFGARAMQAPLQFGDFSWYGLWYEKEPIMVCGDRKKLGDIISSVENGRHVAQVQRAYKAGYKFQFIVLEARYRKGGNGLVEEYHNGHWYGHHSNLEYYRLEAYLNQMAWMGNVHLIQTETPRETVERVVELYSMFQMPPEEHSTLNQLYSPPQPKASLMGPPSLLRRMSKELQGVGWGKSGLVEEHFGSVERMVNATQEEWQGIYGVGKTIAENVYTEMREVSNAEG